MKQLSLLLLIGVMFAIYSCGNAEASKPNKPDKGVETLAELGFTKTSSAERTRKLYILNKYGLNYHSDADMDSIMRVNSLIHNPASTFIAEVPDDMAALIIKNFKKVEKEARYYRDAGSRHWWPIGFAGSTDKGIMVIAPADHFDAAAIRTYRDPIVAIKVDGGWIELARW